MTSDACRMRYNTSGNARATGTSDIPTCFFGMGVSAVCSGSSPCQDRREGDEGLTGRLPLMMDFPPREHRDDSGRI